MKGESPENIELMFRRVYSSGFSQRLKTLLRNNPIKIVDRILIALVFSLIRMVESKLVKNNFPNYKKIVKLDKDYKIVSIDGIHSKSKLFLDFTKSSTS